MNNTYTKLGILIAAFFLVWFSLKQLNWVEIFRVKEVNQLSEEKLGEVYWQFIETSENVINDPVIQAHLNLLVANLCKKNDIDTRDIKVHLVQNDEVNAFALPGGHLVVYSGLIEETRNQSELCGVLGHEIAHITLKHVMKKLGKEVGLSVLLNMTSGSTGGTVVKNAVEKLTSSAYDRDLEREADMRSVSFMLIANMDPNHFANFMERMDNNVGKAQVILDYVSTHPNSKERAAEIREAIPAKLPETKEAISEEQWTELKTAVANY